MHGSGFTGLVLQGLGRVEGLRMRSLSGHSCYGFGDLVPEP